jgi:exosortase
LLRFAPVFAACIFLIPIGTGGRLHFAMPLETAAAHSTQTVCDLVGMAVDRAGNKLSINGVDVTIAEACNGMRMVLTLFMVCYVVAFSTPLRGWVRFVLLAASPLVAIVANVVRLVPTIWMYGNASTKAAERFHDIGGWVMTVAAFLVLMGLLRLLRSEPKKVAELSSARDFPRDGGAPGRSR